MWLLPTNLIILSTNRDLKFYDVTRTWLPPCAAGCWATSVAVGFSRASLLYLAASTELKGLLHVRDVTILRMHRS